MTIMINGMEMPNHCEFCGFCHYYGGNVWCNATNQRLKYGLTINKPNWCPLVEVPTPHGRLIDADEFEKYVELEYETREISHPNWIKFRVWCGDQPTIIEAEE